jgi:hypothetical protein
LKECLAKVSLAIDKDAAPMAAKPYIKDTKLSKHKGRAHKPKAAKGGGAAVAKAAPTKAIANVKANIYDYFEPIAKLPTIKGSTPVPKAAARSDAAVAKAPAPAPDPDAVVFAKVWHPTPIPNCSSLLQLSVCVCVLAIARPDTCAAAAGSSGRKYSEVQLATMHFC